MATKLEVHLWLYHQLEETYPKYGLSKWLTLEKQKRLGSQFMLFQPIQECMLSKVSMSQKFKQKFTKLLQMLHSLFFFLLIGFIENIPCVLSAVLS